MRAGHAATVYLAYTQCIHCALLFIYTHELQLGLICENSSNYCTLSECQLPLCKDRESERESVGESEAGCQSQSLAILRIRSVSQ